MSPCRQGTKHFIFYFIRHFYILYVLISQNSYTAAHRTGECDAGHCGPMQAPKKHSEVEKKFPFLL